MRDLESVVRPFGKEVLRQFGIDRIVFNQQQFDHRLVPAPATLRSGSVVSTKERRTQGELGARRSPHPDALCRTKNDSEAILTRRFDASNKSVLPPDGIGLRHVPLSL